MNEIEIAIIGIATGTAIGMLIHIFQKDFSPRYPGKKCVTIYSQGNPVPDFCWAAIDANNRFIKMLGADIVDSILISGSGSPEYQLPEDMKKRAFEAGARLF